MSDQQQRPKLSIDERIDALFSAIEASTTAFYARIEALTRRHEALTMNMELAWRENEAGRAERRQDAEHIHALVRLAEIHEHRLTGLEGPRQQ
jgi:hypothetical protein